MEHRVKRVVFELSCPVQAAAFGARTKLMALIDDAVVPALDQVLAPFAPDDRTIEIDRIDIDLGRFELDSFDAAHLRDTISVGLRYALRDLPVEPEAPQPTISLAATFAHFLSTGALPWHAERSLAILEAQARALQPDDAARFIARLRPLLHRPPQALRFALQFSAEFVRWVLGRLQAMTDAQVRTLVRTLPADLSPQEKSAILVRAAALMPAPATRSMLRTQVEQLAGMRRPSDRDAPQDEADTAEIGDEAPPARGLPIRVGDPARPPVMPVRGDRAEPAADTAEDVWYVPHAGIVLLHPFFARFFEVTGLLDARQQFRSPRARERAVHLLHFLAAGREHPEEHATLLFKLLCGLPFDHPMARECVLRNDEKNEANALLAAAIGHWARLGSTSPAGLREGFLARDGKIARADSGYVLTVEQRAVDVLLDTLPWTLSIVRLSWMARPLMVNWA